jgi:putative two-component system response regulator
MKGTNEMDIGNANTPRVLVVDDQPDNLHVMKQILMQHYQLLFAKDGDRALALAAEQNPDLILLDVMMPGIDGFETCKRLKQEKKTRHIPVIFVTAMSDIEDEAYGFELGAVDYIAKPVSAAIVRARVKTHLSLVSVNEIHETRLEIIRRLGRAAEYKDNETGLHVIRMSNYSMLLGKAAGMPDSDAELLLHAAPMHDIGKIGIPDSILLNPGKLSKEEWVVMRRHPEIGAEIIGKHKSRLLEWARIIALTHHEKWDGTGYPKGLAGKDIPLIGRVVAVADVFDALTTERPYKKAWPVQEALDYLNDQRGRHFDLELVELFMSILPQVFEVKEKWAESHADETGVGR